MKTIYDLELHEWYTDNNARVLRVPGGWIYHYQDEYVDPESRNYIPIISRVFVPFNNEFMKS